MLKSTYHRIRNILIPPSIKPIPTRDFMPNIVSCAAWLSRSSPPSPSSSSSSSAPSTSLSSPATYNKSGINTLVRENTQYRRLLKCLELFFFKMQGLWSNKSCLIRHARPFCNAFMCQDKSTNLGVFNFI